MITYQDYLEIGQGDKDRMDFVRAVIKDHKNSAEYKMAKVAEAYYEHQNLTIMEYQKLLYTMTGQAVPDNFSANYKLRTNLFNYLVTQENQYILGNGTSWGKKDTKDKLGTNRIKFDSQLMKAGETALVQGQSFGFFNLDHLEVFGLLDFAPLYDEENGALMVGVRFWQLSDNRPLRATLYEIDGYTDYAWGGDKDEQNNGYIVTPKRAYTYTITYSEADGEKIYNGENYPSFPIVPMFANSFHRSEFDGMREWIDCYDLIMSGFANTIDEASYLYWSIQNAAGMDDVDLSKFLDHMRTVHAAVVESEGATAESHTIEAPYNGRKELLNTLRSLIFDNFMALDVKAIASGAITATQIEASYEPMNGKANKYEDRIREFVYAILDLVGIDDEPTWTRSRIINRSEEITSVLQAAQAVTPEYVTRKILTIFGDGDLADDMLAQMDADEIESYRTRVEQLEDQVAAAQSVNNQEQTQEQPEEKTEEV